MRGKWGMMARVGKGEALERNDSLPDDLDCFLAKGMSVVDDCLVIGELTPNLRRVRERMDRTGFECFVNHVHLKEIGNRATALRQAIAFCRRVSHQTLPILPNPPPPSLFTPNRPNSPHHHHYPP